MNDRPPLPNFFIAGAMRSGTTSLARYLQMHPQVFIPLVKEVDFFSRPDNYERGVDWYRRFLTGANGKAAIGDASPLYMYIPDAIPRMASLLPDAKIIVLLRNPVDRAYSQYWMRRSWKIEKRDFRAAITAEPTGTWVDPVYLAAGMYCAQLKHICEFYPRSAIHVALFEDLRRDPRSVFADVCKFLSVDATFVPPNIGTVQNPNYQYRSVRLWWLFNRWRQRPGLVRRLILNVDRLNVRPLSYPPMDPNDRAALTDWFREPNRALADWLGRALHEWNS